ncbi:MAG: acyl-CoA dehydrogenase C-terminal domain-containing protein [Cycloclasticus sp.]|jgi:alkylation response protein AidB-like acyl-CoA dehydrogenase|nr:acyl-CoA dehydrogenase C-terminal domain-containing protein [Cycloclasticus sp.]
MATLKAPIEDIKYLINEFLDTSELSNIPIFSDMTADLTDVIFEEAGKISETLLFPLNRTGDEQGCSYHDGIVTTPDGFKEAYQEMTAAGWGNLICKPEYGGQGLPHYIANAVDEMLVSSNMSFTMYMGLTIGAYNAIDQFACDELKGKFLSNMVSGKWSGTMCLTEPQCGTDLGLIRTKAVPQADGSYSISGSKIFITAGEHDLTENILHLVLARTPDAPKGIKGISLFLVPKLNVNDDGTLGEPNRVFCSGIEHKMGINGSSTCSMEFENSKGFLVGDLNKGMKAMFIMMNSARLHVGIQGLAIAQASYCSAKNYAKERIQGRALTGSKYPDQAADPLIVHPDIRRMLMTMKAYTEGARALSIWLSYKLDVSHNADNKQHRQDADDLVSLLTPVFKSFLTEIGETVTSLGIQVYGGHGYIRENGMEQYLRDARISKIYEGANGIQALDLVGRKLPEHMGKFLRHFFHPLSNFLEQHSGDERLSVYIHPLAKSFSRLQQATLFIAQQGLSNPNEAGAAASDYLDMFGLVAIGYMWAKMAEQITRGTGEMADEFYDAKLKTGLFYMQRILPQTGSLLSNIMSGCTSTMSLSEEQF